MERNRVCKICSRRFSNGKAMGGHMRSHFAKLPPRLPPATLTPSSSLSLSTHQRQQQHREKPRTSVPPAAQDRAATVHDRGSDTEPSRRRGKRNRSRRRRRRRGDGSAGRADAFSNADVEQTISSVSETSETLSEADVALCLIMLSRDKWPKRARTEADEHEDDGDDSVSVTQTDSRAGSSRPKYQCETCNRGFGSYQALGGHRASHKKMSDESHNHKRRLAFECPYCHKVFDSGQALGGHKKVHNEAITVAAKKSKNCGESSIDLNLPAPEENGEGETTASLVEISSVSNEVTLYPIKKAFLQV